MRVALLPAAVLAPIELQAEFGEVPSGMVPLDSRPVLSHIVQGYRDRGLDVVVAAHERADVVDAWAQRTADSKVRVVGIGTTDSIGSTVLRALRRLPERVDQLVVNFADTILRDELADGDVVVYQEQDDTYRWTTFRVDDQGRLGDFIDKGEYKSGSGLKIFVGVFGFADAPRFVEELETALAEPRRPIDPFYTALRRYMNAVAPAERHLQRAQSWFDVGHLDTYYTTRRTYFLNARSFNSVQVDPTRGVIRKSSANAVKFRDEVRWYLDLPRDLRHIAPRVFDHDLDTDEPWVEMEFYGYPTLNDAYLVGQWDVGLWRQVFRAIGGLLDQMGSHLEHEMSATQATHARRDMYEAKTLTRLEPVLSDPQFQPFLADNLMIDGELCFGLPEVVARLPEVLAASGALRSRPFSVIHGDLCLSNILYDRRNSIVRVVDPRGSFGVPGVYGDPLYDLAKLAHSLEGDYDLLVNGLFDLRWNGSALALDTHLEPRHHVIKAVFDRWLRQRIGDDFPAVQAVQGLLFLSMVPLHADRPVSQQAFLARGLQLFTKAARTPREVS